MKCKVPGATFLRKQSRHGRYILDEMEETIVKCAHSHSVRADALITFVDSAGDIDIFYEIVCFPVVSGNEPLSSGNH